MKLPLLWFLAAAAVAFAQTPPAVVSPEVHADRRVTFRVAAPNAQEVTFKGDWHADPLKMEKGSGGVWSVTLGPLAPSTYIYQFNVDGVAIADPVNPQIKLRMRTSGSLVDVPAEASSLADPRDVPHGAVEMNWQKSAVLGDTRAIWVYTPPGYAQERERRYPVLFLLHGSNDRPAGWVDVGHIHFIADNLIAEKKAVPMIIVMPVGHALPFGQPAQPPRTNTVVFEEYLLRDVQPLIEAKYRVAAGRKQHAIAGMSMGGEQALHVFFNHLDQFAAVGAFSPGAYRGLETTHAALLEDAAAANARIDVLWIGAGRAEPPNFTRARQWSELLTGKKIRHVWYPTDGAHNYAQWREHVIDFLPRLFK